SMSAVSVISSSNRSGGSPDSASAYITTSDRLVLQNCTGDRLTATLTLAGQVAASTPAACSTSSPICVIKPVSAGSGMSPSAEIMPVVGCRQRTSASTLQILPVLVSMIG